MVVPVWLLIGTTFPLIALADIEVSVGQVESAIMHAHLDRAEAAVVEISASRKQQLKNSTVGKTVIDHDELVRFGDGSLTGALKRVPGITTDGEIRIRGLGQGYTQILINGDPAPQGFSIDSLSPELVERIEVQRSATADQSAQAIAGSINIIMRKNSGANVRRGKLGVEYTRGGAVPFASVQLADKVGDLSYSLAGVARKSKSSGTQQITMAESNSSGQLQGLRATAQENLDQADSLSLAPRITWVTDIAGTVTWQNYLEYRKVRFKSANRETTNLGDPSQYPVNAEAGASGTSIVRSDLQWEYRIKGAGKISAKLGINRNHRDGDFFFRGQAFDIGSDAANTLESSATDDAVVASGKYTTPFLKDHSLTVGWDAASTVRKESRLQTDRAADFTWVPGSDEAYSATVRRVAGFAQDEWDLTEKVQMYLGVRWESLLTKSSSNVATDSSTRSAVWSPVWQLMWRLPEPSKDQVRMSMTRTYRAPATADLVARRYTVNNDNNPTRPDRQGNPDLKPELAWGFDLSWEHQLPNDGLLKLGGYVKRVDDVMIQDLSKVNGTWITRPYNDGRANLHGVEVESRLPLRNVWDAVRNVELRANVSWNWSKLADPHVITGRLADPFSGNIGLDYKASSTLSAGSNLSFRSAANTIISSATSRYSGVSRILDTYITYKYGKSQLKVSMSNILRRNKHTSIEYLAQDGSEIHRNFATPTSLLMRAELEFPY